MSAVGYRISWSFVIGLATIGAGLPTLEGDAPPDSSPPVFPLKVSANKRYLAEAHYDLANVGKPPDFGSPSVLRREEYWTMLTGGVGQFYGKAYTWSFKAGWQSHLDIPGVAQLKLWKEFFTALPWQDLVPDQKHTILTAGFGTYGTFETRVS